MLNTYGLYDTVLNCTSAAHQSACDSASSLLSVLVGAVEVEPWTSLLGLGFFTCDPRVPAWS